MGLASPAAHNTHTTHPLVSFSFSYFPFVFPHFPSGFPFPPCVFLLHRGDAGQLRGLPELRGLPRGVSSGGGGTLLRHVEEQLCEPALGGRVVLEGVAKRVVSKGVGEALEYMESKTPK